MEVDENAGLFEGVESSILDPRPVQHGGGVDLTRRVLVRASI